MILLKIIVKLIKKRMMKKYFTKKGTTCYFEIFMMILTTFSISYLIYSEIHPVNSQADSGLNCCEKTKSGESCLSGECDVSNGLKSAPTACSSTDFCKTGCCISPTIGTCQKMTSKATCDNENGTFQPYSDCNIEQCKEGCCVMGNQNKWLTQKNCEFEGNTQNNNIPTDWRLDENSDTELKCLFSVEKGKEGACVFPSGNTTSCVYTTLEDCITRTGNEKNFDKDGRYCSNPDLNTTCKAKDHKGCVEGKEDVYWYDSCNNPEDVSEDCNLFTGTYCGKDNHNSSYMCKDVNCLIDGVQRRNGESWCEYDGKIGDGKDPVGSRHIKHICYMGTERIEPCADYRNEICVETDSTEKDGKPFAQAACRVNTWRLCFSYNSKKGDTMIKKCKENPDCTLKHIEMGEGFKFDICSAAYPPGFNLDDEVVNLTDIEVPSSGDSICSIATQRCTEVWICGIFGCICKENCACHTAKFTNDMNDLCISLGDCGAYINYIGTFTDGGYSLKSTGAAPPRSVSAGMFSKNAGPQDNQTPASPGTFDFYNSLSADNLRDITVMNDQNDNLTGINMTSAMQKELQGVVGSYGSPLLYRILSNDKDNVTEEDINAVTQNSKAVNFAGFFNGISSVKSSISAQITKKDVKAGGFEMLGAMIAGAIAFLITQSIMITLIAAMLAFLFMIAWIKYVDIDFTCDVWERPSGGDDCNKCNKMEIPCSEYRCQSLGQLCKFVNKGTPDEMCISQPVNETLPYIEPFNEILTPGFQYKDVTNNGFTVLTNDGNCIDPFNLVKIGIKVSPFAKCKFGYDRTQNYDDMPEKFGVKGNSIIPAHQMNLVLPSIDSIVAMYNQGAICNKSGIMKPCNITEEMKDLGTLDMYVKCKSASGRENAEPYHIHTCVNPGEDLTPPVISSVTFPTNNGYIKYGEDVQNLTIFVNEPSECRWSKEDKDFSLMENNMTCESDLYKYSMYGLTCTSKLEGIQNSSKFYVRCNDLSKNHNNMTQSYVYQLSLSSSPLTIEEFKPEYNEEIIDGVEPTKVELRLKTSGGANGGIAICDWNGDGYSDQFTETNASTHSYEWTNAFAGRYTLNFRCEDIAGNVAENSTTFKVTIDNFGPKIVRAYNDGDLKIITSEPARCKYDSKRLFIFDNATEMDSDISTIHSARWSPNTYYIECRDVFNNPGSKVTIRPYDVKSY